MNTSRNNETPGLGTIPEVADYLALSRRTVYRIVDRGDLPSVKLGKSRRIPWAAVEKMVEANTAKD